MTKQMETLQIRDFGESVQRMNVATKLIRPGGMCVQGTSEYGYGVTLRGKEAEVSKSLISASKVHSKVHDAVVDSNGG